MFAVIWRVLIILFLLSPFAWAQDVRRPPGDRRTPVIVKGGPLDKSVPLKSSDIAKSVNNAAKATATEMTLGDKFRMTNDMVAKARSRGFKVER